MTETRRKDRIQELAVVEVQTKMAEGIYGLRFRSERIAQRARPGQFVNVLLRDTYAPLLRRPFSISQVEGSSVTLIYNVIGRGTRLLATKQPGDELDVLGPLGKPFAIDGSPDGNFFTVDTSWFIPNDYYIEIKIESGNEVRTSPKVIPFTIVSEEDSSRGFQLDKFP